MEKEPASTSGKEYKSRRQDESINVNLTFNFLTLDK